MVKLALENEFDRSKLSSVGSSQCQESVRSLRSIGCNMVCLNSTTLYFYTIIFLDASFLYPPVNGCTQKSGHRPEHKNVILTVDYVELDAWNKPAKKKSTRSDFGNSVNEPHSWAVLNVRKIILCTNVVKPITVTLRQSQ